MKLGNFAPDPPHDMPGDQGFVKIEELLAALAGRLRQLREGAMDLKGLETAAAEARELYERIVVLRHLARVQRSSEDRGAIGATLPAGVSEAAPIRLETGPPPDPRQITLIDAIENEKKTRRGKKEKEMPVASPVVLPGSKTSLAEKLEHAPIKDLHKAIAISQKFWFIAELFGKDASTYDAVVKRINSAGGLEEARSIVETEVLKKVKKTPGDEVMAAFMELVERRFK